MQDRDAEGKKTKPESVVQSAESKAARASSAGGTGGDGGGSTISHHRITLPKGGGAISGMGEKFQANPVTGTASFSVPVPVSPDRSGFSPKMSLSYDSGSGNGLFGLGWSIDIPHVSRKTSKGLPTYDDGGEGDVFLLSGAEDLVPILDDDGHRTGRYRPRIEGLFARIEKKTGADGVYWQATTKDNVTSIYGKTASCRIADPMDSTKVFSWLLECTFDAKGNVIWYRYKEEDTVNVPPSVFEANRLGADPIQRISNKHIAEIHYGIKREETLSTVETASPDTRGDLFHYSLVFDYGEQQESEIPDYNTRDNRWTARQDPFSSFNAGFDRRTYRLCKQITLFHRFEDELGADPLPVKGLVFNYAENETATYLEAVTVTGYKPLIDDDWEIITLPPLSLGYTRAEIDPDVKHVDSQSLENLPQGIGGAYQFLDFEGEGLSGIFVEQGNAWFYKRNNGNGQFGALQRLGEKPSPSQLGSAPQLVDVDGDGNNELLLTGEAYNGYYSYVDGRWENFQYFARRLNLNLSDPKIKQIDLTGDGRPDLLMAEDNVFTWHESLLKEGYGQAQRRCHPYDEEKGPRVVFAEAVQTVFLADMCGDGLTDIVRIRNGEVCYWPNLGYGRFGAKVTMAGAPYFDYPDQFNPRHLQLGDVDGSGTADIFYFGSGQVKCWLNRSGNSLLALSEGDLPRFLPVDSATRISIVDLMGRGTSCLVWSTANPNREHLQMSYVDLMSKGKPHLLSEIDNHMGKRVTIAYAPSTEYYLRDRQAGTPWITKLPFPVHVIREVETEDLIGGTVHHAQYRYHHGFFDGPEREFRGFGFVETLDTKVFEAYSETPQEQYVKPVLTKTWFHNGAFIRQGMISRQYESEYFLGADNDSPDVLPDTVLEDESSLTTEELREAYRSMKTKTLRQEVWEADPDTGLPVADKGPYTAAESNFVIRRLQEKGDNKNAVFVVHPRETITWHYEQNATDPRIAHEFTLQVDDYGNIERNASVVYPRKIGADGYRTEQGVAYATCGVNRFIHKDPAVSAAIDFYLVGVPSEAQGFELGGLTATAYLGFDAVSAQVETALSNVIPFDQALSGGTQARRLSWQRYAYWNADQSAPLLDDVSDKALLHHVETAVFTPGLIANAYGAEVSDADLEAAGYFTADNHWWNPGLKQIYSNGNFYLPLRTEDPWGNGVDVTWDPYLMSVVQTEDALGNIGAAEIDYRTMGPRRLTDPNENVAEAVTDALGMVIATSVYGEVDGTMRGDDPIDTYIIEMSSTRDDVVNNPETYLQKATTFFFYDLDAWTDRGEPIQAVGLARETHVSDEDGTPTKIQKTITYTDGFGRVLQTKLNVEDGPAWVRQADDTYLQVSVTDRWLSSGRTVYNNKEKRSNSTSPFTPIPSPTNPKPSLQATG